MHHTIMPQVPADTVITVSLLHKANEFFEALTPRFLEKTFIDHTKSQTKSLENITNYHLEFVNDFLVSHFFYSNHLHFILQHFIAMIDKSLHEHI